MKLLLSAAIFVIFFATVAPVSAELQTFAVDPDHSTVGFKIKHLGISTVGGTFGEFDGQIMFDPDNIASASASASITAKSISTNHEKRDAHLRNEDFFDVEKKPTLSFASSKVTDVNGNSFKVHGDLTMNGVSKPVILDAEFTGQATDPWGNERIAFSASTKLDRTDFGLSYNKLLDTGGLVVGHEVKIELEIEAIKKK